MVKKKRKSSSEQIPKPSQAKTERGPKQSITLKYHLAALVSIVLLVSISYSNSFNNTFQFDDIPRIVENQEIRSLKGLQAPRPTEKKRYVVDVSLWLNYRLGGYTVTGYHAFNFLIHITNCILAYFLVLKLLRLKGLPDNGTVSGAPATEGFIALGTALLFGLHPIQTQSVTYIIQRAELLAGLFGLMTLLFYIDARRSSSSSRSIALFTGAIISYFLAFHAKAQIAILPVIIILMEVLLFRKRGFRKSWKAVSDAFIPIFLMLVLTAFLLHSLGESYRSNTAAGFDIKGISRADYALTNLRVVFVYLRLLVLPIGQNLDHDFPLSKSLFDPLSTLICMIIIISVIVAAVLLAKKRPLHAFSVFFFFLMLAPSSGFIPIVDVMFEHRLYMPCLGVFLLTCLVLERLHYRLELRNMKLSRTVLGIMSAIVIIALTTATLYRNSVWHTPLTLWTDVVRKSPEKSRGYINLGLYYFGKYGDLRKENRNEGAAGRELLEKAFEELNTACKLDKKNVIVHTNMASIYLELKRYDDSIEALKKAIKYDPMNPERYRNLAYTYFKMKRFGESVEYFETLPENKPKVWKKINHYGPLNELMSKTYLNLGIELQSETPPGSSHEKVITAYKRSIELYPTPDAHYGLGWAFEATGRKSEALKNYIAVLELNTKVGYANEVQKRIREIRSSLNP